MRLSMREEIVVLTVLYCFCLISIPIILIDASSRKGFRDVKRVNLNSSELEFQRKVLIDSINILENINGNKGNSFVLSDLLDLTEEEFKIKFLSALLPIKLPMKLQRKQMRNVWNKFKFINGTLLQSPSLKLPLKVDWRDKNVTSAVKAQQTNCGSCFAVAVIETIESMMALKTRRLEELSIQQMIDCNGSEMGCQGGDPCQLLKWLFLNQIDVQLKENYPPLKDYSTKQACDITKLKNSGIKVKDYLCDEFVNSEELMLLYLAYQGPLVASINALPLEFYDNEIVEKNCDSKKLNHVVQIVGYDLTDEVPFYIVKNSWGTSFGTSGYMKVAIGRNVCGIAKKVAAVIV